MRRPTTSSP
ncbi:hypothetical protein E2C01_051151 [Portunus trituberculatus]|uniref:Uncharacterized protein n=1 Tax=Portunus trituberculatus TaxID=210409 RepID=A0A5B7GHU6_PORTR|nr:hypothetical protein [Portunus trituberculatus]